MWAVLAVVFVVMASALGVADATTSVASADSATTTTASASASASAWTVYHGDATGSGVANGVASVTTASRAWTSPALDGHLYGEPLVSGSAVYVATENDTVYALSSSTGAVVWTTHLATPVPSSDLPCGDISPVVGVTGTPVIDPARGEIFVVADELVNGSAAHMLVGLNTTSGSVEMTQDVDPPGSTPTALLQRTGLTLDGGQVVFGFGGNFGDCASYRGRVVAVPETGGTPVTFTVDSASGDSQGAVWMGGAAPSVDASGHIWVGVGNGSVHSSGQTYDDSDSALELSSSLQLLGYFAPSNWPQNNAADLDMSIAPVLLPDGQVVVAGKSRIAYLLNGADLGGIGGQEASLGSLCSEDIDGGSAVVGTTVYLPCASGIVAVSVTASPPGLSRTWSSGVGGGPPIVAAGLVWTIGQEGTLYGLDPSTGTVRQQASIGAPGNHFPTPSVGDGLLLAPSANDVVAFVASSSTSAPTATTTTTTTHHRATKPKASSSHGTPTGVAIGVTVGAVVVILGVGLLARRRRRRRVFY